MEESLSDIFSNLDKIKNESVTLYCDGAIKGNNKKDEMKYGGIGIVDFSNYLESDISIPLKGMEYTNNKIELIALALSLIFALEKNDMKKKLNLTVITDSEYTFKGYTQWSKKWVQNDYIGISNKEIWVLLERIKKCYNSKDVFINVRWVRGHTKLEDENSLNNDKADKLAVEGKMKAINDDSGFTYQQMIEALEESIDRVEDKYDKH